MTARQLRRVGTVCSAPLSDDQPSVDSWRDQALCAQADPEAWFPEKGGSTRYAKRVCAGCPVTAECLEFSIRNGERFGVWGGLSERQRRPLLDAQPDLLPPDHKPCSKCDFVKPLTAFHWSAKRGYSGQCASCRNASYRQRPQNSAVAA